MNFIFKTKTPNPNFENLFDVPPQEVLDHSNELTLVDVRETAEYTGELGHVIGTRLVVLSTIPEKLASIPKDKPIVFICRSGGRSSQAAHFAKSHGVDNVYNMMGGMLLWNQLALPVEK